MTEGNKDEKKGEQSPLDDAKAFFASGRSNFAKFLGFASSSIDIVKNKAVSLQADKDATHHTLVDRMRFPFVDEWLEARHKQIYETSEYLNNRYKFSSSLARSHQMQVSISYIFIELKMHFILVVGGWLCAEWFIIKL